ASSGRSSTTASAPTPSRAGRWTWCWRGCAGEREPPAIDSAGNGGAGTPASVPIFAEHAVAGALAQVAGLALGLGFGARPPRRIALGEALEAPAARIRPVADHDVGRSPPARPERIAPRFDL